jgi:predicted nucleic acid-binding protein
MGCTFAYAELLARGRSNGSPIAMADACIAAIAATHRLTVATRDTAPFVAAGVEVIDPWGAVRP